MKNRQRPLLTQNRQALCVSSFFPLFTLISLLAFFSPPVLWAQVLLEDPQPGSYQSGIALIRGWACNAEVIEIQIDEGPRLRAAYGTTRLDTQSVCDDADNGFGLTWNWNLSGDGAHRVRAFVDGFLFADYAISVTTFGEEFLTGRSGGCTINNFPQPGSTTTLAWQQSLQNFVIVGGGEGGGGSASDGNQRSLEDPGPGSNQSGIALIRGWACNAEVIEIQIDEGPRLRAAYGTTRLDTRSVCGDADNGFGLTWNWNLVGSGLHRVRVFADGVLFADVTFPVTTFNSEFLVGAQGGCTVNDFPQADSSAELTWQQSLQNFLIRGVDKNSVDRLVRQGFSNFAAGNVQTANESFTQAVAAAPNDARATLGRTLTRIAVVALSDPRILSLLSRSGASVTNELENVCNVRLAFPSSLPAGAPRTGEIFDTLRSVLAPEIDAALIDLNRLSRTFNFTFDLENLPTCLRPENRRPVIEIDGSDLTALTALLQMTRMVFDIGAAYNVDVDLQTATSGTAQQILTASSSLLTLRASASLGAARTFADQALANFSSGITSILAETDDQFGDFLIITPADRTGGERLRQAADLVRSSLQGQILLPVSLGLPSPERLNLNPFFSASLTSLRPFVPAFDGSGNFDIEQFPDPTFAGMAPDLTQEDIINIFAFLDEAVNGILNP